MMVPFLIILACVLNPEWCPVPPYIFGSSWNWLMNPCGLGLGRP